MCDSGGGGGGGGGWWAWAGKGMRDLYERDARLRELVWKVLNVSPQNKGTCQVFVAHFKGPFACTDKAAYVAHPSLQIMPSKHRTGPTYGIADSKHTSSGYAEDQPS